MRDRLKKNVAKCAGCGHVLESTHRHDYRTHECVQTIEKMGGTIERKYWFMVDGGLDYCRRGWDSGHPSDHYIELSEYRDEGETE